MPKCEICGILRENLTPHLRTRHALTAQLYQARFPEAEIVSRELKKKLLACIEKGKLTRAAKQKNVEILQTKIENKTGKVDENRLYSTKDIEQYGKFKQKYMSLHGFQESPELEELLFLLVTNEKLQSEYNLKTTLTPNNSPATSGLLNDIRRNNDTIQNLIITISDLKGVQEKTKDIVNLHKQTMDQAEKFVHEHAGEFVFRCGACGQVLDTYGNPHPFFEGEEKYSVFSQELWALFIAKKIPISYIAFALHTSVESLLYTAKKRGDTVPPIDLEEAEKNLRNLQEMFGGPRTSN